MIIVANNSGIGNRIKNVVSALRKGHLHNDTVHVNFDHKAIFQYAQCISTPQPTVETYTTWHLELLPEDAGKKILKTDKEFLLIHDKNQVFHLNHHIDFQFDNIENDIKNEFLRYFDLIILNKNIIEFIEKTSQSFGISNCVGVHIRSWIDEPTRHALLHDTQIFIDEMHKHPASNFYVCSDSQAVVDELLKEFPGRILYRPLLHTRHITFEQSSMASLDAIIDLLLLSRCKEIIGSYESTFTECAWWLGRCKQPVTIPKTQSLTNLIQGANHEKSI